MPNVTPHLITGTIRDIYGNLLEGATVTVTHTTITPVLSKITNSAGEYTINLSKLDSQWIVGEELTIFATKTAEGRKTLVTTINSSGGQTHNLTLEETSDFDFETQPDLIDRYPFNMAMLTHYDGGKVTRTRPLPVLTSEIDLVLNPSHSFEVTNSDGQPESETITIADGTQYKRTFSYTQISGARIQTAKSKWEKQ